MGDITEFGESLGIGDVGDIARNPVVAPIATVATGGLLAPAVGATAGTMLASAGMAAAAGGDPIRAAILGGVQQVLPGLGGDLGQFFGSEAGKGVLSAFLNMGGGGPEFSGFLESLGISGSQKDVVEEVLALIALTGAGKMLAKDAISKANTLQEYEYTAIQNLVNTAQTLSDPANMEKMVQKAQEDTRKAFGNERKELEMDLYARGLGERTTGPMAALSDAEARAELEARRGIEMDYPLRAIQAQSAIMPTVSGAAQYYTDVAEAEKRLPLELGMEIYKSRQKSPMEQYYEGLTAQQATPAASSPLSGLTLGDITGDNMFEVSPYRLPDGTATTGGYTGTSLPNYGGGGYGFENQLPEIPTMDFNYGSYNPAINTTGLDLSSGSLGTGMAPSNYLKRFKSGVY